jgi:ferredoxin-NADP reductase
LNWQPGTVLELIEQTARTKSIVFDVPAGAGTGPACRRAAHSPGRVPGASAAIRSPLRRRSHIELTVERIDDGEVSPFLADELRPGGRDRAARSIGGYFAWEEAPGAPVFLVGGGSGSPLRAMLRHHRATGSAVPVRLLYSALDPRTSSTGTS